MGRRTKASRKSNSDKKIEELYNETLKEAKEGKMLYKIDEGKSAIPVEEKRSKKSKKRPQEILEESIRKQQEVRKQRGTLTVPVSRLVPFRNDSKGFHFPQDFRRDDSLSWIPRSGSTACPSPCGITEYERLLWGESCSDRGLDTPCNTIAAEDDMQDFSIEDTLHVLPLRSMEEEGEEVMAGSSCKSTIKSNLPPIYRRAEWRETIQSAREPSRSIPARSDAWCGSSADGGEPLVVGKQGVFSRQKQTQSKVMSLAERRSRMRAKSSTS